MVAPLLMNLQIAGYINIMSLIILNAHLHKLKKFRRFWIKPHLHINIRDQYGAFKTLFQYFKQYSPEDFYHFVGMTVDQFDQLLIVVRHRLIKRSRRKALEPELCLAAVLNYLRHGTNVQQHCWFFFVGESTMYKLVPEVCKVIFEELSRNYLVFPNTDIDWMNISQDFEDLWNFPYSHHMSTSFRDYGLVQWLWDRIV